MSLWALWVQRSEGTHPYLWLPPSSLLFLGETPQLLKTLGDAGNRPGYSVQPSTTSRCGDYSGHTLDRLSLFGYVYADSGSTLGVSVPGPMPFPHRSKPPYHTEDRPDIACWDSLRGSWTRLIKHQRKAVLS